MDKLELKEGSETWERCEEVRHSSFSTIFVPLIPPLQQIFKYTLFLEQRFWPDVE